MQKGELNMKIDISKIEGYEKMPIEDKLKALESFEIPEPDYSKYVKKDLFDKTASELADKKKELRNKLSEEEAAKLKEAEERKELQEKYEALLHKTAVSENKAKLLGLGYEENLASETAEAMTNGDLERVFANQKIHLENFEKQIRANSLKNTPKPVGDGDNSNLMTLKKFREMSTLERLEFSKQHPEEYKELYNNGGNQ